MITNIAVVSCLAFTVSQVNAQVAASINQEVEIAGDGKMLIGNQVKDQFLKAPYADWYVKEHDEYTMDQKALNELKKYNIDSYTITLFMGTWCEDSHRDVPRLMRILEEINYPAVKLIIIAVNRKKESPSGQEKHYKIEKVPTIILEKDGKETGRIVEMPTTGYIERDLVEILKKYNK
ncbi:thioredoxin family protein [Chryseobacterium sp. SSA4.19]|uniref:TlpA family protein disulfide reductase n=1 Tax=Chryseobacterium sp. SSA4.19 TaxID=2919915 RepID=UPI001F4D722A|nr:thioredoxin family protein [Chryseobacterium sp. SSA4.19]MCJ8153492.1 thioredoxin family protein [Chryseobacterium sp. SSA4.19]